MIYIEWFFNTVQHLHLQFEWNYFGFNETFLAFFNFVWWRKIFCVQWRDPYSTRRWWCPLFFIYERECWLDGVAIASQKKPKWFYVSCFFEAPSNPPFAYKNTFLKALRDSYLNVTSKYSRFARWITILGKLFGHLAHCAKILHFV